MITTRAEGSGGSGQGKQPPQEADASLNAGPLTIHTEMSPQGATEQHRQRKLKHLRLLVSELLLFKGIKMILLVLTRSPLKLIFSL